MFVRLMLMDGCFCRPYNHHPTLGIGNIFFTYNSVFSAKACRR